MDDLLRAALFYHKWLDCNIVFERIEVEGGRAIKRPVHGLRPCKEINKDLYSEKMTAEDVKRLYYSVRDRRPSGVGIICNLSGKNFVMLDFDSWQDVWSSKEEGMLELARSGFIVIETPRGFRAMHLLDERAGRVGDVAIYYGDKQVGEGAGVKSMHKWTMPPSRLSDGGFQYRFIYHDPRTDRIYTTLYPWGIKVFSVSQSVKSLFETLELVYGLKVAEVNRPNTISIRTSVAGDAGLRLDVDGLSNKQATALLYMVFKSAGCRGLAEVCKSIYEKGVVPVRKEMYGYMRVPRTTRWLLQYVFASVMVWLGFSGERVLRWLMSWKFVDEDRDPRRDSTFNALYNVSKGLLDLMPRGACPFCPLMGEESCADTPLIKVRKLGREKILSFLDIVKSSVT